ncbi:MAG: hypothetical protein V3T70_01260, partial [Phycisphaerae bacterium]
MPADADSPITMPLPATRVPRFASAAASAVTVLACTAALAWVQFSYDGLLDGDSYFHTRAARELDRQGVQREFPQTAFSTWRERYSDKDFLFHLLLIPFQRLHAPPADANNAVDAESAALVRSGKQAAVVFDLLVLAALALALHLVGARFAPIWLLLFMSTHGAYLMYLLPVRPHMLGFALLILEVALLMRGAFWWVIVLGVLHTWAHSSFFLLPVAGVILAGARFLRSEPLP